MARSRGCKQWDLIGILCYHACATIIYHRHNSKDYVDECYGKDTYLRAYATPISSMPGLEATRQTNENIIGKKKTIGDAQETRLVKRIPK
jgi:hypothetical protein